MKCGKKLWSMALVFGLGLSISGCKSPPITECLLTIHDCDASDRCIVKNDCRKPDGTFIERNGMASDGACNIDAQDRRVLLNWAKANCDYDKE